MTTTTDPARIDAAVRAVRQARQRHTTLVAVIARRTDIDLNARRMRMLLGVFEPVIVALENLLADSSGGKQS